MRFSWTPPALMVATGLALQPSISLAQSNIGSAASVRNQVEGILGGQTNTLSSGSTVHSNELIRSGDGAVANLVFIDETKLSVGPRSEVRLDKFVYDPNKNTGTVVVRATKGAYRFVTGVQDPRNYEIKTSLRDAWRARDDFRGESGGSRAPSSSSSRRSSPR